MWLVVTVYVDGMDIGYGKFRTKKAAIEYLEDLGYEKEEVQRGRRVAFHSYCNCAEIIPMDEIKNGDII